MYPKKAIDIISPIYKKLLEIEKEHNISASEALLTMSILKN